MSVPHKKRQKISFRERPGKSNNAHMNTFRYDSLLIAVVIGAMLAIASLAAAIGRYAL